AVVPYSGAKLCTIGFQGLRHDETTGLIDNRARIYLPDRGVFGQRDPLGYPDGANSYTPYHVLRGEVDPSGLSPNRENAREYEEVIEEIEVLEERNPDASAQEILRMYAEGIGNGLYLWRYVYTQEHGWLDMGHFTACANAQNSWYGSYLTVQTAGAGVEVIQFINHLAPMREGTASSSFTYEDFPSNYQGSDFGEAVEIHLRTNPDGKLSEMLTVFFQAAGASSPNSAPDYSSLASCEEAHEQNW
ncbi:unnamed protein product, partial [Laminaria digitata]